jgi:outer membrane protein TolC
MRTPYTLAAALLLPVGAVGAQSPLRLADALAEADRRGFANRQASASAAAERARAVLPLKGILPSARVEGGFVRTTDPIGAFGTTLRQRAVTPAAFDPERLNNPAPVNNVTGGLVLEVPVLNADAWTGWRAARAAAGASEAMADWTGIATRADVVRAYYGAVLAGDKVATLRQAQRAAESAVTQVRRMVQQGLVTKADELQAAVRAGDVAAQLLGAEHEETTARQQVAMLLGRRDASGLSLPASLPNDAAVRTFAERQLAMDGVAASNGAADVRTRGPADAEAHNNTRPLVAIVNERDDVRAARLGVEAARADRQRAASTLLPRVNGFARYDYNNPATLYAGRPNWTVGVMGSWSLFGGAGELADLAGADARARAARAGEEAAQANARLEADAALRSVTLALQRLDLAAASNEQAREAHRLVEKRYAGGLATIAERLGAESAATGAQLAHAAARYAVIEALALYRRAVGGDPSSLAALDDHTSPSVASEGVTP